MFFETIILNETEKTKQTLLVKKVQISKQNYLISSYMCRGRMR